MTAPVSASKLAFDPVASAAGLRTLLRENGPEGEQCGRMPASVLKEIEAAGLFQLLTPAKYGGSQVDLITYMDTMIELGRGDMGFAWATNVINGGNWTAAMVLPQDIADRAFNTPKGARFASVFAPRSFKAQPRPDGLYIEEGMWSFNSAIHLADWDLLGVPLVDADGKQVDDGMVLVPVDALEILDDWNTTALRGSGSNSVRLRDYFVPQDMIVPFGTMRRGEHVSDNVANERLYRISPTAWGPLILTFPIVGAGYAAIDHFLDKVESRGIQYTQYKRQADAPVIHLHLGRATAKIDAAKTVLARAAQLIEEAAGRGDILSAMDGFRIRRDSGYAITLVWEAVDALASASGGSFMAATHPLNRVWRDVRAGTQHGAINIDTVTELYGRLLCGLSSNMTMVGIK